VVTNSSLTDDAELKLSTIAGTNSFNGWIQDGATKKTSLVVAGVGTQTFVGVNTYTGGTRIDGGTLALGHATNTLADSGAINVNGGVLALGTNTDTVGAVTLTSGSITGSGAGTLTGTSYDVQAGSISAKLAGASVSLTKTTGGTVTLSGTNSYGGGTTVTTGTLTLGHATNTLADTGAVNVNGGILELGTNTDTVGAVTLTSGSITGSGAGKLTGSGSNFDVRSGTISAKLGGTVGLDKTTGGTVTINSNNSTGGYTGATTVTDGTLIINGNISTSTLTTVSGTGILGGSGTVGDLTIAAGGTHNPGNSPGIMNTGDYTMAGTLNIEAIGNTAGVGGYDQVNVTGTVNLSGTLVTAFTAGTYASGNLLFILLNDDVDAITGTFASLAQGALVTSYGGFDWSISYTADSTANTFTGGNDVALMAVPEPRAAMLGLLGALALLRRRR
jgi:autotransporter-associated beta strand protein